MREIRIRKEESGQRLDKFLRRFLPGAGTGFIYKMLRKKNILLDGRKAEGREILQEGSLIRIYFSDETLQAFQAPSGSAIGSEKAVLPDDAVVYEDKNLMIINKPAGILTQKASDQDISLTEMVRFRLLEKGVRSEEDRLFYEPGPANRIDRNTSGLVVYPLTLSAARQISQMFRERTIHKRYLTLVAGEYRGPERLTAWCMRNSDLRKTEILFHEQKGADRIETICEPLVTKKNRTLLRVTLVTGRTHQIRSHLQSCGYPVIGDPKYGRYLRDGKQKSRQTEDDPVPATSLRRQFLHAWQMEFPSCGGAAAKVSEGVFTAPLPRDLLNELSACGIRFSEDSIKQDVLN